jgi:3D (Asp-Asp-Asp) domain-containing protein
MLNRKILIRLFLTIIYFIIAYVTAKNTLNVIAKDTEVEEEITVEYYNESKSMSNVIEVEVETEVEVEKYKNLGEFKLTGYCACEYCCGKTDGITATGTKATSGRTIAVDPSIIPYGSLVKINGREYVAEDCGGAIKNNKIDIFFDTHEEALQWGVKYAEVFIKVGD